MASASSVHLPPAVPERAEVDLDSPKKRQRGRPLKESTSGNVSEQRRSQVRRAQETYQRRKRTATKTLEQRIGLLEECVEHMSNVFMEFTDSMFKSEMVRKDPGLSRQLFAATSSILKLAQTVNREPDGGDEYVDARGRSSLGENNVMATPHDDVFLQKPARRPFEVPSWFEVDGNLQLQPIEDAGRSEILPALGPDRPPSKVSSNLPGTMACNIYQLGSFIGNGLFGENPLFPNINWSTILLDRTAHGGPLGFALVQNTLRTAYEALLGESGKHTGLAKQMFRFSLQYHTREELLFSIRWFLGPGVSRLPVLGRALFGPKVVTGVLESGSLLSPFVDASAQEEAGDSTKPQFLNAFGVEDYLKRRGAFQIDQEIIRIEVRHTEDRTDGTSVELANFGTKSPEALTSENPHVDPRLFPEDSTAHGSHLSKGSSTVVGSGFGIYSQYSKSVSSTKTPTRFALPETPISNASTNIRSVFSFNALLEGSGKQQMEHLPESSRQSGQSTPNARIVTLSMPLLLQNLVNNSICLGNGPGYPPRIVDHAIKSSMITTSVF